MNRQARHPVAPIGLSLLGLGRPRDSAAELEEAARIREEALRGGLPLARESLAAKS